MDLTLEDGTHFFLKIQTQQSFIVLEHPRGNNMRTFNIYTKSTNCKSCYNEEEILYPLILDEKKSKTEEIGG